MDCETNDCRKEKRGCVGCFYSERNSMEDEFWKEQERLRREERIMRELEKEDE